MPASLEAGVEHIEILPIVVVAQDFPARPSALPDVRDFVRRQLTTTSVADEDIRTLCERVADVLLDAAGVGGTIQVSLRIFPTAAEVDVLFNRSRIRRPGAPVPPGPWRRRRPGRHPAAAPGSRPGGPGPTPRIRHRCPARRRSPPGCRPGCGPRA